MLSLSTITQVTFFTTCMLAVSYTSSSPFYTSITFHIYLLFYQYIVLSGNDNLFFRHAESFCNYSVMDRYHVGRSALSIGHFYDQIFMYSFKMFIVLLFYVNNFFGRNIETIDGYLFFISCLTTFLIVVVSIIISSINSEIILYSTRILSEEPFSQWNSVHYKMCTYNNFYLALSIACVVTLLLIISSFIVVEQRSYLAKSTGYECGFDPFADFRKPLSVKFFLVSILFIIFDIELLFFFPWVLSLPYITIVGFFLLYFFFVFLGILFLYEWYHNCMEW